MESGFKKQNILTQALFQKVFFWMFVGLISSAITAQFTIASGFINVLLNNFVLFIGLIIIELILVVVLASRIMKMDESTAKGVFVGYALINGVTISAILIMYTLASVVSTFIITALMFGSLALIGFFTKKDLSGMGLFFLMALVGLIIASIVNIFMQSSMLYWAITCLGILIFAGLTVYDTNKIKKWVEKGLINKRNINKFAIIGALSLYLDFVNMFIYMLRIFGKRR